VAISTYAELKSAVEDWLERGDLGSRLADIVTLAESRLNRDIPLRAMEADIALTGTSSSRLIALSTVTNFYEPIALYLTTFGVRTKLHPFIGGTKEVGTTNGVPRAWSINGTNIELDKPCDQAHTFSFHYRKSFALSDSSTTTELLTSHPDVYLSACLVEGFSLPPAEPDKASYWESRYQAAKREVRNKEARNKSIAPLTVDPALLRGGGFNINEG
jgi:hypothetical protein